MKDSDMDIHGSDELPEKGDDSCDSLRGHTHTTPQGMKQDLPEVRFEKQTLPQHEIFQEWERLSNSIAHAEFEKSKFNVGSWTKLAAAVTGILLLASATLYWYAVAGKQIEVYTPYGEIKAVTLPDGSTVVLNANSTLTYRADFNGGDSRSVWLAGEAFFEVKKGTKPFVVHSDETKVEVLGTSFNVNNRRGEETTVVVRTGRVVVKNENEKDTAKVILRPGELTRVKPSFQVAKKVSVDTDIYSAWKDQRMVFNNTPLSEIADLIQENFNLTVVIKSESLKNRKLSGTIQTNNVDILLEALSKSFNLRVIRHDGRITLEEKI
jgi:transmembrane sensor